MFTRVNVLFFLAALFACFLSVAASPITAPIEEVVVEKRICRAGCRFYDPTNSGDNVHSALPTGFAAVSTPSGSASLPSGSAPPSASSPAPSTQSNGAIAHHFNAPALALAMVASVAYAVL